MEAFLKLGGIFCWAVAIGSEYAIQKWPRAKKTLNRLAMLFFFSLFARNSVLIGTKNAQRFNGFRQRTGIMSRSLF